MAVVSPKGLPVFKTAKQLAGQSGLNTVIFGPPGIGKTTLLCGCQDSELGRNVLLFDIDGGFQSVSDRDDIAIWPDRTDTPDPTWVDFRGLVDKIIAAGTDSPYLTYIFDSVSSIYNDLIIPHVTGGRGKQPALNQWGECTRLMVKLIQDVKTLNALGINTLFIGHVQEDNETVGTGADAYTVTNIRLAITPKARDEILRVINTVGYYGWDAAKKNRVLHFQAQRRVDGPKFQQPQSGPQMPLELKNPSMGEILKYARRGN